MMTKLKEKVTRLVDFELDMANKEHGERFNSAHEAYAVMKEEYEEAADFLADTDELINRAFWENCKRDDYDEMLRIAEIIRKRARNAACECIQVAAMAQKFINGEENI